MVIYVYWFLYNITVVYIFSHWGIRWYIYKMVYMIYIMVYYIIYIRVCVYISVYITVYITYYGYMLWICPSVKWQWKTSAKFVFQICIRYLFQLSLGKVSHIYGILPLFLFSIGSYTIFFTVWSANLLQAGRRFTLPNVNNFYNVLFILSSIV